MTEAKDVGLKQWVLEIDKKVDNILEFMHKMEVHLDYTSKRIDTQCEKLAIQDNRLKAVEDEIQKHKGETHDAQVDFVRDWRNCGGGGSDHYDGKKWLIKR